MRVICQEETLTDAMTTDQHEQGHRAARQGTKATLRSWEWHVSCKLKMRQLIMLQEARMGGLLSSRIQETEAKISEYGRTLENGDFSECEGCRNDKKIWWDNRKNDLTHLGMHCQKILLGAIALFNKGAEGLNRHENCG